MKYALLLLSLTLVSCGDGLDDNYVPYDITGLDVWVYDMTARKDHFAGHVSTTYKEIDDGLAYCQSYAAAFARQNHLRDWRYVCCTTTDETSCKTKVR